MNSFVRASVFLIALGMLPIAAVADEITTVANNPQGGPLAITRCSVVNNNGGPMFTASLNLYNRSTHGMSDVSVQYRFFDRDNAQIGEISYSYTPHDTLSPDDTETLNNNYIFPQLAEPVNSVARVVCRSTAAHFTGRVSWRAGSVWQGGALHATPKGNESQSRDAGSNTQADAGSAGNLGAAKTAHVNFSVERSWNEKLLDGSLFVHDALIIHGGENVLTIRPADIVLTMTLAAGGDKTFSALTQSAPLYKKYSALTRQFTDTPLVDPALDLGHLGSVTVQPHADAHVIVTFSIVDRIADPTANQRVAFR